MFKEIIKSIKMKKSITAKARKELERRFGKQEVSNDKYYDHLDFRLHNNFTDEAFAYLMENVKGVNMLDLNETDITNESIALLTNLEYVNEIRAKQCRNLDNACIPDLNKLTSLVFLHVRSTDINIDGLLKLNNLINLKTLMFSADDAEAIKEKLLQLKVMLPQCDMVINSKPYQRNAIDIFVYDLKNKPFTYRLEIKNKTLNDTWSSWLTQPSDSYIEAAAQGPYAIDDIEWIEINPQETKVTGKLIAPQKIDYADDVIKLLDYLGFPYMIVDSIINVFLVEKEIF